ncbi:MAG TPA: cupredoxin domain-containing protein [Gemmatimonadales bacterium]|nr:cupredoxin domain-containing protein [Gemmatimonadales bacterium]
MSTDKLLVLLAGLALIGWILWYFFRPRGSGAAVVAVPAEGGVQEAVITVKGGYDPGEVRVAAGRPVRLIFDRQETNPCSDELVIPEFRIHRALPPYRRTAVEFTPGSPGTFDFKCGMGMLHGKLIVT